jgi:hypothetical protein
MIRLKTLHSWSFIILRQLVLEEEPALPDFILEALAT